MKKVIIYTDYPKCDICHKEGEARYDAKTTSGPWGFLCPSCFKIHGVGLGMGIGQMLIKKVEKDKVLSSFTTGDIENPITLKSIQDKLEQADKQSDIERVMNFMADDWKNELVAKKEVSLTPGENLSLENQQETSHCYQCNELTTEVGRVSESPDESISVSLCDSCNEDSSKL